MKITQELAKSKGLAGFFMPSEVQRDTLAYRHKERQTHAIQATRRKEHVLLVNLNGSKYFRYHYRFDGKRKAVTILQELKPLTGNGRYIFLCSGRIVHSVFDTWLIVQIAKIGHHKNIYY
jgi:hypothetical protein